MLGVMEFCSNVFALGYRLALFFSLAAFVPLRKKCIVRLISFVVLMPIATIVIFLNDMPNIPLLLGALFLWILVFTSGSWAEKITALLVFYPMVTAANFLQQNVFSDLFFSVTHADADGVGWSDEVYAFSTLLWTISRLCQMLLWIAVLLFVRRNRERYGVELPNAMWLTADALMLAASVGIFTTTFFLSDIAAVVYPLCVVAIMAGLGGVYLIAYLHRSAWTSYRAQKLESQQKYFADKLEEEERVRAVYHDMKNHLLVLEQQGAREMAEELREKIASYEDYIHTGNDILDIIVREKAKEAREKQIDFSVNADLENVDFLDPFDVSTLFGNGIDNAMEASMKLPAERRVVTVKARRVHDFLSVLIENNCVPAPGGKVRRTSKKDAFLHGFGIPNMRKAAERYGGTLSMNAQQDKFVLKILIPMCQKPLPAE